jgi:hypothetical protein
MGPIFFSQSLLYPFEALLSAPDITLPHNYIHANRIEVAEWVVSTISVQIKALRI